MNNMKNVSRKHHYLSEFYLNGFAENTKNSLKITVINIKEKRKFKTIAKGLANIRDFNRVNIEGEAPDFVEMELSRLETRIANAIRSVHEDNKFESENRALILELIAMFAARNPSMRSKVASLLDQVNKNMLLKLLENDISMKEKLSSMLMELHPGKDITNEDMKKYVIEELTVEIATEYHIFTECQMIVSMVECLNKRKWTLLQSSPETGFFITSDSPVVLCWENPDEVSAVYRNSPGFAMPNTVIYFPLSKKLALIGTFEGENKIATPNKIQVATANTMQIIFAKKQLYMPNTEFYFIDKDKRLQKGGRLVTQDRM